MNENGKSPLRKEGMTDKSATDDIGKESSVTEDTGKESPAISESGEQDNGARNADGADDGFFGKTEEEGVPAQGAFQGGGKKTKRPFALWVKPPRQKKKYSAAFYTALSALSGAAAVIFLMLGFFSDVLIGTGYIIAEIALMIPLAKRSYAGSFVAYLATVVLALIFGAVIRFWDLVPFVIFFGLHPIFNCFQRHWQVNFWLAEAVKAIWFDGMLFVAYFLLFHGVFGMEAGQSAVFDFINKYFWLFIIVLGTAFFAFYDYVMFKMQRLVNFTVGKVKK